MKLFTLDSLKNESFQNFLVSYWNPLECGIMLNVLPNPHMLQMDVAVPITSMTNDSGRCMVPNAPDVGDNHAGISITNIPRLGCIGLQLAIGELRLTMSACQPVVASLGALFLAVDRHA